MEGHGPKSWLLQLPLLPHDESLIHVNAAVLVTTGIAIFSVLAYFAIKGKQDQLLKPSPKFSFAGFVDVLIEGLYGMIGGTLGPDARQYFSFVAALFLFVLFSNLFGLIPLSHAPTANVSTNFALGMASFVFYNAMGVKAHGLKGYLAHFLMGLGPLGVFVAIFEIISHVLRPATLSLRLYLNLNIDHTVVHTFQELVAWLVPVPLLLFGIVVCTIQAFVFATLSAVYIQLATEHEHEHGHEAHH